MFSSAQAYSSSDSLGLMSMAAAVETIPTPGLGHDFTRGKMYHYGNASLHNPMAMSSLSAGMLQTPALPVVGPSLSAIPREQPSSPDDLKPNYASTHTLSIRQQPENARVAIGKEKDRKPIDPPPILQLNITTEKDPHQHFLQSPYFFMTCTLVGQDSQPLKDVKNTSMVGSLASSLHKLKDTDNTDGGFFIFPDLSVKIEGKFRLQFTLFEFQGSQCSHIASITSEVFTVWPAKTFPGMAESTFLTRSFSDQGVRLRLRKDSRSMTSRKRSRMDDYPNPRYTARARTTTTYDASGTTLPRIDSSSVATHEPSQSPQDSTPRQSSFPSPYGTYDRLSESRSTVSSVSTAQSTAPYYYGPSYVTSNGYPSVSSSGLSLQTIGSSVPASMYPSQNQMPSISSLSPYGTDPYGHHESSTFASTHDLHSRFA